MRVISLQILFSACVWFISESSAQVTFQKTYGGAKDDVATDVIESLEGGYVICGFTKSFGAGSYDAYLMKTDQYGDTLWTKTYGGPGEDYVFSVIQTADSGYAIAGHTSSFGAGGFDCWLLRINKVGDTLWTKAYGGSQDEYCFSLEQTFDQGFIMNGGRYFNISLADPFVMRIDSTGNLIWNRSFKAGAWDYSFSALTGIGASGETCLLSGVMSAFNTGYAPFLIMLDQNGDTLWTKRYFDDQDDYGIFDYYSFIRKTPDGGLIFAGSTGTYYEGYVLLKLDNTGNYEWIKGYGDSGFDGLEKIADLQITTDGGFILSGYCDSFGPGDYDFYVVKVDSSGDVEWSQTYGGNQDETRGAICQTNDGGYIIAGATESLGAGHQDIFLIKTDEQGISGCNEMAVTTSVSSIVSHIHSGLEISNPTTDAEIEHPEVSAMEFETTTACLTTGSNALLVSSKLLMASPNPFSTETMISFSMPHLQKITVQILDVQGRLIRTLANESMDEGEHMLTWDARDENGNEASAGIYFLKLQTPENNETIRLSVVK